MSLKDRSDEQLDQLRIEVLTEQERRRKIAGALPTIREQVGIYLDGGGSIDDVIESIANPPEEEDSYELENQDGEPQKIDHEVVEEPEGEPQKISHDDVEDGEPVVVHE